MSALIALETNRGRARAPALLGALIDLLRNGTTRSVLPRLPAGMLMLADRGYCSFPLWQREDGQLIPGYSQPVRKYPV